MRCSGADSLVFNCVIYVCAMRGLLKSVCCPVAEGVRTSVLFVNVFTERSVRCGVADLLLVNCVWFGCAIGGLLRHVCCSVTDVDFTFGLFMHVSSAGRCCGTCAFLFWDSTADTLSFCTCSCSYRN